MMIRVLISFCVLINSVTVYSAVLVPGYFEKDLGDDVEKIESVVALLAFAGIANRERPRVFMNSSSESWATDTPVMWSYPEADSTWISYITEEVGIQFEHSNGSLCAILEKDETLSSSIRGIVMYEKSDRIDALKWLAVSASGLLDGIPVTASLLSRWTSCLGHLPVLMTIPSNFSDDLEAYDWGFRELLPNMSTSVIIGSCYNWNNYTCGWGDPLGTASIDFAVSKRGMVMNLSPNDPDQASMFKKYLSHLKPGFVFGGWAEPEPAMTELVTDFQGVVQCGAPNLSFLSSLRLNTSRLPLHLSQKTLNRSAVYLTFQSNEGDTPKNAYSFRQGNWLKDRKVPIAWGVSPIIAELFPGLWDFYTATAQPVFDQFFGATGGYGYTHPWSESNMSYFFDNVKRLKDSYMPLGTYNWIDNWEGGCPENRTINPCNELYERFSESTGVNGFSQQPTMDLHTQNVNYVHNEFLPDGTPIFLPPTTLWYPQDKGFCDRNLSLIDEVNCIVEHVENAMLNNTKRPLFILAYGVDKYVEVANSIQNTKLNSSVEVIGAQDLVLLGRLAAATNSVL